MEIAEHVLPHHHVGVFFGSHHVRSQNLLVANLGAEHIHAERRIIDCLGLDIRRRSQVGGIFTPDVILISAWHGRAHPHRQFHRVVVLLLAGGSAEF